jgi:hypothetical protein
MKIPKPLLILIVIIVILGVLSCSAGVIRGFNEEAPPSPEHAGSEAGFDQDPIPVPLADVGLSDCSRSDQDGDGLTDDIAISSSCDVTIENQFFRSRVLRLWVLSIGFLGPISVQQEIDGEYQPDPPKTKGFNNGGLLEISASGVGAVHVRIKCSCILSVNPT